MGMPSTHSRTSLLGIPPELRIRIYEYIFFDGKQDCDFWGLFHLYTNLYDVARPSLDESTAPPPYSNDLGILGSCKQLHREASQILYADAELIVSIMGMRRPKYDFIVPAIGRPEDLGFWRFIRQLRLQVYMESGSENKRVILERIGRFAGQALECGRHLRKLEVIFTTPEYEALPSWFGEVVEALKVLNVDGDVRVFVDGNDDGGWDEICGELKSAIMTGD